MNDPSQILTSQLAVIPTPPAIGRIVHYTPDANLYGIKASHIPGIVTGVYGGTPNEGGEVVSLTLFPAGKPPHPLETCVRHGQPGEAGTWHWPERV